jgi:hypothetical protein
MEDFIIDGSGSGHLSPMMDPNISTSETTFHYVPYSVMG